MKGLLRRHGGYVVALLIGALISGGGPSALAAAYDAINSDKVDGKHAVGASATRSQRAGKLVATNGSGRLPNNIISKAPDADKLDGVNITGLQRRVANVVVVSRQSTALRSGQVLRRAYNAIGNASASNRYVVLLGPGVFHLGSQSLNMKPYVALRGSGRTVTTITSARTPASSAAGPYTIRLSEAELADLTVTIQDAPYTQSEAAAFAYNSTAPATVRNVDFRAPRSSNYSSGIYALWRDVYVENSTADGYYGIATFDSDMQWLGGKTTGSTDAMWGDGSGNVRFAGTQIIGSINDHGGLVRVECAHAYGEFWQALGSFCG